MRGEGVGAHFEGKREGDRIKNSDSSSAMCDHLDLY